MRESGIATYSRRTILKAAAALPVLGGFRPSRAQSRGGDLLDVELNARQQWKTIGGREGYLFTFNGLVPGPLLQAKPGNHVRIRFRNDLPEATNLHYHGLHIPPGGNADNIFLHVPAGEEMLYEFDLPTDHPGATFWYHPHVHGTVARQVSRGLAGVFIVRGELDEIPEIAAAPEFIMVLQDFALSADGLPTEPNVMERLTGREGGLVTVSGLLQPSIPIQRKGWVRLRILNTSSSRYYRLRLDEHPFQVIASDGGPLPSPESIDEILLVPGERVDVMIRGDRPEGVYRFFSLPYDRGSGMGAGMGMGPPSQSVLLATLNYQGQASSSWDLPATLLNVERLPEPSGHRTFQLGMGMGMTLTINGRSFAASRIDTLAHLDTVEDWHILNLTTMDHPMHIHTNAFQITSSDGLPARAWKDVVNVPANGSVQLRIRFRDFAGTTVYHCHILDHEDLGMMGTLEIGEAPDSLPCSRSRRRE
jgi:FtsP/CotA-like multicopper oxidase with cupredoxin domain